MKLAARILVGVLGAMSLLIGAAFWADPAKPAANLGILAQDTLGLASLRADNGGLFAGIGILALAAAIRDNGRLLTAPTLFIALALSGRFLTVALSGYAPNMGQPIVVEVVTLMILALGRRTLSTP